MAALSVAALRKRFPRTRRPALDGVSLSIGDGRTLAIVGPSGAGKSTLLRIVAGLERADAGDVRLGERSIARLAPQERRIAMVFQDDALAPHLSVEENLRFALRDGDRSRVGEVARVLRIAEHLPRRPRALSGGERQRVALGRALLSDPRALGLDEPLAHVDPALRARIRDDVLRVRERFEGPILYVTHDHAEAMAVADVLAVLIDGRIEQIGDPQRIYDAPGNVRIARFLGAPPMNLLTGVGMMFGYADAIVGVRPECVSITGDGPLRGRVVRRESTGADGFLSIETPHGSLIARVAANAPYRVGESVGLAFAPAAICRYDPKSGELLR